MRTSGRRSTADSMRKRVETTVTRQQLREAESYAAARLRQPPPQQIRRQHRPGPSAVRCSRVWIPVRPTKPKLNNCSFRRETKGTLFAYTMYIVNNVNSCNVMPISHKYRRKNNWKKYCDDVRYAKRIENVITTEINDSRNTSIKNNNNA